MGKNGSSCSKKLAKKEDEVLTALYRCWRRMGGKMVGEKTDLRDPRFECAQERYDYYASFFMDLADDVNRLGGSAFSDSWLWFLDASAMGERLSRLLDASGDDEEKTRIRMFAEQMCSLDGHCPIRVRPRADEVSRTHILWLTCERMLAGWRLSGDTGVETFSSVKAALVRAADVELATAGFSSVDYRNPLDGYLAFSLYRARMLDG